MNQTRDFVVFVLVIIIAATVVALTLWFAMDHTIRPTETRAPAHVVATTSTTDGGDTAHCLSADGWPFRTSPAIAKAHHLNCEGAP